MVITLVAAMARNRVIGINSTLPWYLPEDLQHFKAITLDKPVIMGRKTFDSIGRPLIRRRNIVLTRQVDWVHPGVERAVSLNAALLLVGHMDEVCVIGGAALYHQALPQAGRLYLTEIDAAFEGDTFFPMFDVSHWQEVARETHISQSGWKFAFVEYRRCCSVQEGG